MTMKIGAIGEKNNGFSRGKKLLNKSCKTWKNTSFMSHTVDRGELSQWLYWEKNLEFFNDNYIILKGVLLPNTWAGQQHKYLKHGGREPVASKKMTLGQVVPHFTGQVVSSKLLRIFR